MAATEGYFCGIRLRPLCFVIAYLHLISIVIGVLCHILTMAIATNGFQCDINYESVSNLQSISVPWLEPILMVLNIGSHGFYPYPRVFRNQYHLYVEQMPIPTEPRCYPGMLHVYLIDVLNFLINVIWMRIVFAYVGAVHKKNPEPMRMFFSLAVVKLVMQALYFGYQPFYSDFYSDDTVWFLKLVDNLVAILFLVIVRQYIKQLRLERAEIQVEKPPSYIECLINVPTRPPTYEPKEEIIIVEEKKPNETVEKS